MVLLTVLSALTALTLSAATVNGTVSGVVVDDTGRPVAGARVVISHKPPSTVRHFAAPPVITGAVAATVTTDTSGAFRVDTIRAGNYLACAQTLAQGLLDPCRWAISAPEITVVAGQVLSGVKVTMARGAVISIHVNDPQNLLKPATGPIDFDCQFHVVTAKGLHYNASIQASTTAGRDHAITVPFGTPLTLQAIAPHLVLNDQNGKAVPVLAASVAVPAGVIPATLSYTVAGKK